MRSNILHHGFYAPEDSLYLPIKSNMEEIKYKGNANGMTAEAYAKSIVPKLMGSSVGDEIWEGKLAWWLRFLVTFFPLRLVVSAKTTGKLIMVCSTDSCIELVLVPSI